MSQFKFVFDAISRKLLLYYSHKDDIYGIKEKIEMNESIIIKRTFTISPQHVVCFPDVNDDMNNTFVFEIGSEENDYIKLYTEVIRTKNTFYFAKDILLTDKLFCCKISNICFAENR